MTELDIDRLLKLERALYEGSTLSHAETKALVAQSLELWEQKERSRRVLARWERVQALLDYLKGFLGADHELTRHIDHVLSSIGGQP